jgi:mono/diheme cytochrome c family protein
MLRDILNPGRSSIGCWSATGIVAMLACVLVSSLRAGETDRPSAEAIAFFESKVRPVLAENCYKCHGAAKQKGGLRLDSKASLAAGGEQGQVVVPGRPEQSLIVKAIQYDGELKMPPAKKLAAQQIAHLTQWVKMGAPWPGPEQPAAPPRRGELQVTAKDRAHWAFQAIKRPTAPTPGGRGWARNPVDAFILAKLEARGLKPNLAASKRELIRRASYDLTGLPPTPEEVEAFVADPAPGAYEALVDRLLDSPHYGEKWGRHWLDLVRFAETNSYERDNPKPNPWRYRDYVIRAFNDDKPYDQFLREQLAGDELPGADADSIVATAYYRLGIWDDEPTDPELSRYDGLDDIVATTGQAFLGLTVDCARCHDHKIDPIPQKDYYRLLAFFQNINPYRNGGPTDEVKLVSRADGKTGFEYLKADPKAKKRDITEMHHQLPDQALCVTETGGNSRDTFVLLRGNPHVQGDRMEPAFPEVLAGPKPVVIPPPGGRTTGRRLALANWLASAQNPLPARVMANRVWQYHFGRGIVRSPNNFGTQGDKPTHPELLDWLAAEFIRQGWRMKPLHRLIMTSNAYRMSSRGDTTALAADPTNDLLWRFDMRRLTAEEIRDSVLAVTGNLSMKMRGPSVYPEIASEVLAGQSRPGYGWFKSPPEEQNRRSVYVHVKRSLLLPILESFDAPETDRSTAVRFATTQPTQALGMLNSDFLNRQAAALAERVRREAGTDAAAQVRRALNLITSRAPEEQEVRDGVALIEALQTRDGVAADAAIRYFCLAALNLNEFVYLD